MDKSNPFSRVRAFMSALSAAMAAGRNLSLALAQVGTYESRGHGRGIYSGRKKGNQCTNWKEHMNSERECARRRRQIAAGILQISDAPSRQLARRKAA